MEKVREVLIFMIVITFSLVYLNDLILSRLLGELPDPTDKLLVGCVIGFSRVDHPDAQLHQLQARRGGNVSQGKGTKKNTRFAAETIFEGK